MRFAVRFVAGSLAFWLADVLLPGLSCKSPEVAISAGAVLMLLYLILRPILRILTGIFNVLTLGIVGVLVDAGLVLLAVQQFPGYIHLDNPWWALGAAIIINLVRGLLSVKRRK